MVETLKSWYIYVSSFSICSLRHLLFNHALWTIQFIRWLDRGVWTLCDCTGSHFKCNNRVLAFYLLNLWWLWNFRKYLAKLFFNSLNENYFWVSLLWGLVASISMCKWSLINVIGKGILEYTNFVCPLVKISEPYRKYILKPLNGAREFIFQHMTNTR